MMQKFAIAVSAMLTGLISICMVQPASAGSLHNGWNYAIDSFTDGYSGGTIGANSAYEMYGIATTLQNGRFYIALNGNMPITGAYSNNASDGNIGWGDLLINFTGNNLSQANGNLFGVRFAATNNSGVPSLGVYSNVTAQSVTGSNSGFDNLNAYNSSVQVAGGTPTLADLSATDPYFDLSGAILNSIGSGTKVGDIQTLSVSDLTGLGIDFGHFSATGSQTLGFSFDQSLLPMGNFIATLFAECGNDGIAVQSAAVPEPTTMAGLALATGAGAYMKRRKNKLTKGV